MVRKKRKTRNRRKRMRGGNFQIGTIVKWNPDHVTQQKLHNDLVQRQQSPYWQAQPYGGMNDPYMDAIQQGLSWRGVVVPPDPWLPRIRNSLPYNYWLRNRVVVRSLRNDLAPRFGAAVAAVEASRRYWDVLKEYLVPVRRPAGHRGDQAAYAARLRFADNPGLAPVPAVSEREHGARNKLTAGLVAGRRLRQAVADVGQNIAGFLGNKAPIPASDRQPAQGTRRRRRRASWREGRAAQRRLEHRAGVARHEADGARAIGLAPRTVQRIAAGGADKGGAYEHTYGVGQKEADSVGPSARVLYTNNPGADATVGRYARQSSSLGARLPREREARWRRLRSRAAAAVLAREYDAMAARDQEAAARAAFWAEELPGTGGRRRRRRKSRRTRRKR